MSYDDEQQRFVQGSTIRLVVRISQAQSDIPVEVDSVTLMFLSGTTLNDPLPQFSLTSSGAYEFALESGSLEPGAYRWRANIVESGVGVTVVQDEFSVAEPY